MKFNPDYHSNVVRNLKVEYKSRYNKDLCLTDERIFQIWDENHAVESDDPEDRELPIYEELDCQNIHVV